MDNYNMGNTVSNLNIDDGDDSLLFQILGKTNDEANYHKYRQAAQKVLEKIDGTKNFDYFKINNLVLPYENSPIDKSKFSLSDTEIFDSIEIETCTVNDVKNIFNHECNEGCECTVKVFNMIKGGAKKKSEIMSSTTEEIFEKIRLNEISEDNISSDSQTDENSVNTSELSRYYKNLFDSDENSDFNTEDVDDAMDIIDNKKKQHFPEESNYMFDSEEKEIRRMR